MSFLHVPREGITLEYLYNIIRITVFNPLVTGLALFQHHWISSTIDTQRPKEGSWKNIFLMCYFVLFALSKLGVLNDWLSKKVLNNWIRDPWREGEEIVLITGGSQGVGESVARGLSASSKHVIAWDIHEPKMPFPANVHFMHVDITSKLSIDSAARTFRVKYGDPTILILNAATNFQQPIFDQTEDQIRKVFEVNTISHFLLVKEFVPAMTKANHGHIVTMASMNSFTSYAGNVAYGCTKASSHSFHEGLAQELKWRYNAPKVRTTVVHPGYVHTPSMDKYFKSETWRKQDHFVIRSETAADAITKQLRAGESGQLILPGRYTLGSAIRGLPSWIGESLRNSMKDELSFLSEMEVKTQ